SYVFGSLLLAFFVGVFCFAPESLPEFKQRMLAVSSSLLAGIFAAFMSGNLGIKVTGMTSRFGKVALRAGGGVGVFALVMLWWLSPLAPVKATLELKEVQFSPDVNQISVLSNDVASILSHSTAWRGRRRMSSTGRRPGSRGCSTPRDESTSRS